MITRVYLENWKTHKNTTLSFKEGTNTLIGKIGAGKSSIIDGVCYCLYGDFPNRAHGKINLSDAIMFKPLKKTNAKLVLDLEKDNNKYRIEREIFTKKTNTAKLYKNNNLIAGPRQKDVTQEVSKILGLDYSLFVTIVYSEQNELDYFLKLPPNKRKDKFDELFGIFQLSSIKESANEILKDLVKDQEKTQALLDQKSSSLKLYNIKQLKEDLDNDQEKQQQQAKELQEKALDKETLDKQLSFYLSKKKVNEQLVSQINICDFKINEIKNLLKENDQKNKYSEFSLDDLDLKQQQVKTKKQKTSEQLLEKQELSSKINNLLKNIQFIDKQISLKQQQEIPSNLSEKIVCLEKETSLLSSKLENAQNKQMQIKSLLDKQKFYESETNVLDKKIYLLKDKQTIVGEDEKTLTTNKQAIEEKLNNLKEKEMLLRTEKSTLSTSMTQLEKGFFRCPVCDSSVSEGDQKKKLLEKKSLFKDACDNHLSVLKDVQTNNQSLEKTNKLLEKVKQNKEIDIQIQELLSKKQVLVNNTEKLKQTIASEKLENIDELKTQIKDKQNMIASLKTKKQIYEDLLSHKKEKQRLLDEKEGLQKKLDLCVVSEKDLKDLEDDEKYLLLAKERLLKTKELNDYLNKKQLLEKQQKNLDFQEQQYLSIVSKKSNIDSILLNLKEKIEFLKKNIFDKQKRIEEYNIQEKQQKDLEKTSNKIVLRKKSISNFVLSLEKTKELLRTEIVSEINQALDIIWNKIYPYKDYLSARISTKKDYVLEVLTKDKEWLKVEGFLSGGERACAALSIRIAISLILTKSLGLLILDEPTHNLDSETILTLSKVLENQLPSLVEQIFVITHDQKLLDSTTSKKFFIDRDKEIDGVSVIKEY